MVKTFTTKDDTGCEFICTAYYDESVYYNGNFIRTVRYKALGFTCESLAELKKLIAEKN